MSLFHFDDTAEHGHAHGTGLEALDPRVKLVSAVALAGWVGLLPERSVGVAGLLAVGLVVLGMLGQIPPATLLWRASAAVPFVVVPAGLGWLGGSFELPHFLAMAGRGYVAALIGTLLVSVTPYSSVLAAASELGAPDLLVQTASLVYRYLHVLRERAAAMTASALARGWSARTPDRFAVGGSMLGALLLRSLDRGERVHRAMLARGYTGRMPRLQPLRMRPFDWIVGTGVVTACVGSLWVLS